jgi:hypothetical protein
VLVRLPPAAGRDIEAKAFGVSGGEKGICSSCSTGGERGVLGKGFSRLRSLGLGACFFRRDESAEPGVRSGVAVAEDLSPIWIFEGRLCGPDIDPNFLIPLRTPVKKSLRSGGSSSSAAESEWSENLDSSAPCGRRVSLSAMISHAWEEDDRSSLWKSCEDITSTYHNLADRGKKKRKRREKLKSLPVVTWTQQGALSQVKALLRRYKQAQATGSASPKIVQGPLSVICSPLYGMGNRLLGRGRSEVRCVES